MTYRREKQLQILLDRFDSGPGLQIYLIFQWLLERCVALIGWALNPDTGEMRVETTPLGAL